MFLSQYLDIKSKKWKNRSCGVISLKIVLNYWQGEKFNKTSEELIKIALKEGAYLKGIGWKHKELAKIANKFGLKAKNFDWSKEENLKAFHKFLWYLKRGPVIVSVYKDFQFGKNGHLIVALKSDEKNIYILEPAAKKRNDIFQIVKRDKFIKGWKKRIIFIFPPKNIVKKVKS